MLFNLGEMQPYSTWKNADIQQEEASLAFRPGDTCINFSGPYMRLNSYD